MNNGEAALSFRRILVQLSIGVLLAVSMSACYPRPFFDKPSPPPAPEQPAQAEPAPAQTPPATSAAPDEKRRQIGGVYPGTETFIRRGAAPPGAGVLRTPAGEVTLNFVDADLREVVKAILGDTLGANYIIDPQVQGTVTLQTSQPVPGSTLTSVLESILAVNNATLVESGGIYKIVPADQGIRGAGGIRTSVPSPAQAPGAQVVAVPLKHVSATEVEKILAPFAPAGGILRVDPRRNLVVIGGSRSEVASMLDVIDAFDVDWLAGMSFGLFPVRSASAKTMAEELEKVFGDQNEGPLAGVVRFVPIERLNAVLVISQHSTYVDRARTWISRLDVGEDETPRLYVYYCENSRAEDLANVLGQLFGQPPAATQARRAAQVAPGLQGRTLQGRQQGFLEGQGGFGGGSPFGYPGSTFGGGGSAFGYPGSTFGGGRAGADVNAPTNQPAPPAGAGGQPAGGTTAGAGLQVGGAGESVRIIADKVKNAVLIQAKPRDYRTVEAALRKLDIVPLQVLIEATILEVTLNDNLRYGVEWFFNFGANRLLLGRGGSGPQPKFDFATPLFGGFTYMLSPTRDSVKVIVDALDSVSDLNVISSPQLFVHDNQTASLQVGDLVPIVTQQAQSVLTAGAPTLNSVEYLDTGVILGVTPRVNVGGLVTLDISQTVSEVVPAGNSPTTIQTTTPTISQRKVETTASVQNGETVALGGLITDRRINSSSGLPFLSRLPLIGWLFGAKTEQAGRTEILVLLTPRVVTNVEEGRRVTDELRSRLRNVTPLFPRLR